MVVELSVDRVVAGGDGLAEWDGLKVFVRGAVGGERVRARVLERKRDYAVAQAVEIVNASPARRTPPCRYYPECGGCQLQHLSYSEQLIVKQGFVEESLRRLGRVSLSAARVTGAADEWHYRNKTQYPVNEYGIGFYRRASHHIVDVEQCLLHPESFDVARRAFVAGLDARIDTPYSERYRDGNIRYVVLRTGEPPESLQATVVTRTESLNPKLVESVLGSSAIGAVLQSHNPHRSNRIIGSVPRLVAGSGSLTMAVADLVYHVSPGSFFQVNAQQAAVLTEAVLRLAGLQGNETVLDLYCGVGLTSLLLARHARRVVGIELDPVAVIDARANAAAQGIKNAEFTCADAEKATELGRGEVDVVVLDPPRKGCGLEALASLVALGPRRVVYVSCNPATLARDLAILLTAGYEPKCLELIDMFPQTAHVESICLLERRANQ